MIKSKAILFCSCVLLGFGVGLENKDSKSVSVSDDYVDVETDGNMQIRVKEGKLKNNGDQVIIEATVNSDASIKGVKFTSSNPEVIEVSQRGENAAALKKLKQFTGYVTITARSTDPFVNLEAQCKFRCYNPITAIGDANFIAYQGEERIGTLGADTDEFILKKGLKYKTYVEITTRFGDCQDPYTDGTYVKIENEAMQEFKESIQTALGSKNVVTSVSQPEQYNGIGTTSFYFEFTCGEEFEGTRSIEVDGQRANWSFKRYVPVSSFTDFPQDEIYVI